MAYKTLVASSATQQRWTIDSDAHTLAELKNEFANHGIPFEGMAITEGLCTKAELTRDDAEIPTTQHTVTYNGQTYSRVFLITNSRKNIASGGYPTDRKQFGDYIKRNNLNAAITEHFGNNWTRIKTADLISFFQQYDRELTYNGQTYSSTEQLEEVRENLNNISDKEPEALPDVKSAPHAALVEWFYEGIKAMSKENALTLEDVIVLIDLTTDLYKRLKEQRTVLLTDGDLEKMLQHSSF